MTKVCAKCHIEKCLDDFYKDKNGTCGVFLYCKPCDSARHKEYLRIHPTSTIETHLRRRFGLSIEKRQRILENQNYQCRICGTSNPGTRGWQIDHDHSCCPNRQKTCGKCIRGLLCISCNKGLGDFKDNPEILRRAASYLEGSND